MRRSFRTVPNCNEKAETLHPCVKQSLDVATQRRGVTLGRWLSSVKGALSSGAITSLFLRGIWVASHSNLTPFSSRKGLKFALCVRAYMHACMRMCVIDSIN